METNTESFLLKSCAHCGDGCDAGEHECAECRFFYCEDHLDPQTHDCHTVCVEVKAFELDDEAERERAKRRVRPV